MVVANIDPLMAVDIPHGWNLIPLGKCVSEKLSYGVNAPAIPHNGCHPRYIRITDITEDGQYDDNDRKSVAITSEVKERYTLKVGDIVLARTGASTGKSYLYNVEDGELVYAGFLIKAAVDVRSHNPRFIVAQLRTKRYWNWVAATSMRSGQPGINGKEYAAFLIPIAPKKEQDKIAETLSQLDIYIDDLAELIEKKRGIRDGTLEDLIHGRTRIDGFSDEWNETTIDSCADILQGGTPSTVNTNYWNGDIVWVTPSEITKLKGMYIGDSERKISKSGLQNSSAQLLPVGAILLCSRATIGELAIAEKPMATNQGFKNLVCKDGIDNVFMAYLLLTLKEVMISKAIGTTFLEISKTALKKIKIVIPNFREQQAIAGALSAMDEEILALETERDKMIQIREGAMDDLLTGRVRLNVQEV